MNIKKKKGKSFELLLFSITKWPSELAFIHVRTKTLSLENQKKKRDCLLNTKELSKGIKKIFGETKFEY